MKKGLSRNRAGQEGQALILVAVLLVVLSVIVSVNLMLWARQAATAARRAHEQTAHYSAEAGVAAGLARLMQGDANFWSGKPVTETVDRGAYRVTLKSRVTGGETTYVLESTGWSLAQPSIQRTVQLTVSSPFFYPTVAVRDLQIDNCFDFLVTWYCANITFAPEAVYGRNLDSPRIQSIVGVRRGTVPLPQLSYAAVAQRVPNPSTRLEVSGSNCQMTISGWYQIRSRSRCSNVTVTAPWVGIDGDVEAASLDVRAGSVLVVAGNIDVDQLRFINADGGTTGDGIVVAGKAIRLTSVDFVSWNDRSRTALLALDTNTPDCLSNLPGCTYNPRSPNSASDPSNNVEITDFSLILRGPVSRSMTVFAAPYRVPPERNPVPEIHLAMGGTLGSVGEASIEGSLVSAGDVRLEGLGLIKAPWTITANPGAAQPLFRLAGQLPASGVLLVLDWVEEEGGGS
ncbi:hypothetical protein [Thermaerobacter litoralis]